MVAVVVVLCVNMVTTNIATLFISYFQASQGSRLMSNIREKEGDTACYRGEALWLDTEGEGVHPLSLFLLLNLIFYCFTFSSSC